MNEQEKDQTLLDISEILNETGAHEKLKTLCAWVDVEESYTDETSHKIEEAILDIILNAQRMSWTTLKD